MPPPPSRPTQRDIAQRAGVSITTVSHVVNGTRAVAEQTKDAVQRAVAETGYTGDAIARSLVTGGTQSLGVAMSLLGRPHLAVLMRAIEREAAAAGYPVLVADTLDTPENERQTVQMLRSRRVDGIVLASAADDGAVIDELTQLGVPIVLLDRLTTRSDLDQVGAENVQATSTLTEHLATVGHRRIGFISAAPDLSASAERTLGYRLGLGRGKLAWDPNLVCCGQSTRDGGQEALRALLRLPDPPSAVVVANDTMTAGALRESGRRGIRVGADLALASYDDPEWADLVDPPLTTMAQPVEQIGRTAVRLLLARITKPGLPAETSRMATTLRHRHSCGC